MLKPIGGSLDNFCVDTVTDPISLNPGQSAIIYFKMINDTIISLDFGISTTIGIFVSKEVCPMHNCKKHII